MKIRRKSNKIMRLIYTRGLNNVVVVDCMGTNKERFRGLAYGQRDDLEVEVLSMSPNHTDVIILVGDNFLK